MSTEIKVPDIGDFDAVEVIEVLVAAGDTVEIEQPLITLESDKATMEVPATAAGTVAEVKIKEGDKVGEGDVIALIDAADADPGEQAGSEAGGETQRVAQAKPAADTPAASGDAGGDDGGGTTEVRVPEIGDFDAVEVIEVLVAAGDTVETEQPLITLESDKATMEVPSTAAGTVAEIKVKEGDKVGEGDVIALLEGGGAQRPAPTPEPAKPPEAEAPRAPEPEQPAKPAGDDEAASGPAGGRLAPVDEAAFSKAHASPAVRKYARELGVDLGRVEGSGPKGRILHEDVQGYVKGAVAAAERGAPAAGGDGLPQQPEVDFSKFGETETVELARIRKLSAKALHKSWLLIPHVTQFDRADITELEAFRQELKPRAERAGVKVTMVAFLLKAAAAALREFPDLNSSLAADGEHLIRKKYCHIGVAVDTDNGLVVPVIRDVDTKSIFDLAGELGEVSERARAGKLKGEDLQGGCFSISSLGGVGGTAFTPVVNSPEVAILGVSRAEHQPVWNGSEFVPRLMLPLSLSYDHRVIDGAQAARITGYLADVLGDIRNLLL